VDASSSARGPSGAGLFIALEGVEGSGKTTQARRLVEWLTAERIPHLAVREPGGTATGEVVRGLLLDGQDVAPRAELLLMLAARAALVEEVVRPALAAGKVVVTDRFELSTLAYQGYGRGLPLPEVRTLNAFATGGLAPDVTFLLDVPLKVGTARREHARRGADRIERAGAEFHARVAEGYRRLAQEEPSVEPVDGLHSEAEVHTELVRRLHVRFSETFPPPEC
jgi:dTMP kinase